MAKIQYPTFSEISEFVAKNSYIYCSGEYDGTIEFETRKNGEPNYSQYSELDVEECEKVKKLLDENFEGLLMNVTSCDEFVYLNITIK